MPGRLARFASFCEYKRGPASRARLAQNDDAKKNEKRKTKSKKRHQKPKNGKQNTKTKTENRKRKTKNLKMKNKK